MQSPIPVVFFPRIEDVFSRLRPSDLRRCCESTRAWNRALNQIILEPERFKRYANQVATYLPYAIDPQTSFADKAERIEALKLLDIAHPWSPRPPAMKQVNSNLIDIPVFEECGSRFKLLDGKGYYLETNLPYRWDQAYLMCQEQIYIASITQDLGMTVNWNASCVQVYLWHARFGYPSCILHAPHSRSLHPLKIDGSLFALYLNTKSGEVRLHRPVASTHRKLNNPLIFR